MKELTKEQVNEIYMWLKENEENNNDYFLHESLAEKFKSSFSEDEGICSPLSVTKLILLNSDLQRGELFSNMRMQKFLYLAQGLHLAKYRKPLFSEEIVKWQYGPVVRSVFHEYEVYHTNKISLPTGNEEIEEYKDILSNLLRFKSTAHVDLFIQKLYNSFYYYSTIGLLNIIENHDAYKKTELLRCISHEDLIKTFYPLVKVLPEFSK